MAAVTRGKTLTELLARATNLYQAASRDYESCLWGSWEKHLRSYNRLLRRTYREMPDLIAEPISPLPDHAMSPAVSPSANEQAKLSEVVSAARALFEELQRRTTSSSRATRGRMTRSGALESIQRICDKFHRVARILGDDQPGRQPFIVTNEADLQRLLHALLLLEFDDVRPEEYTPSYADHSARVDFLIRPHGVVVETKMIKNGSSARSVGNQLILDIARYRKHPECRVLCCFVYDPQGYIRNPRGLERDLDAKAERRFIVKVAVRPRGT